MGKKKDEKKKKKSLAAEYLKVPKEKKNKEKKPKEEKFKKEKKDKIEKVEKAEKIERTEKTERIGKAEQLPEGILSAAEAAAIFRALGDESRMQILRLLEEKELYGMELLQSMEIVQSTLSHHMKILTETGLVLCRREGKRALYTICPSRMAEAAEFLKHYRGLIEKKDEETTAE